MPKRRRRRKRQLSIMVIHRIEDAMELVASIEGHRERLVAALAERYAPRLRDGEVLPDWGLELELTVRDLLAALKRLVELDDQVDRRSSEHETERLRRDRLVGDDVYPRTVSVRGSIDLAFGRQQGRDVHLIVGRTDRTAWGLERQLRRLVQRLADPTYRLPPAKNPHVAVDREGWVKLLRPRHEELEKLNRSLSRSGKDLDLLAHNKRAAMKSFDADYGDALRHVQATFRRARFDALLLRNLRPYYQRRRLARRAREARAAAAAAAPAATPQPGEESETARAPVPQKLSDWLEKRLRFGT